MPLESGRLHTGWHAHDGHVGGNFPGHHGTGTDDSPLSDVSLRHHGRSNANQHAGSDQNVTAQMSAGRDMCVVTNLVVVINCTAGVQDHIVPDDGAGVYDYTRANQRTRANLDIIRDDSGRMDRRGKTLADLPQPIEDAAPNVIIANCHYDRVVRHPGNIVQRAQDRQPQTMLPVQMGGVIQETCRHDGVAGALSAEKGIRDHLPMPTCAEDENLHTYPIP
jgi:hypothetical protein